LRSDAAHSASSIVAPCGSSFALKASTASLARDISVHLRLELQPGVAGGTPQVATGSSNTLWDGKNTVAGDGLGDEEHHREQ
jgi:hypothetical protein